LIAEPWDVGEGGYQVGNFPPLWTEWNGKYRDTVRDFWRGQPDTLPQFAYRLAGSSDLYAQSNRRPVASINFVTCHDGFTLRDLVSYNYKHNDANGEANRDGSDDNRSWNCGYEGPTDDPGVLELRARQQRNFLATLFLSQGVPMLSHGDELGRTQRGNNNAYCQDNDIAWVDWAAAAGAAGEPAGFVRLLSRLHAENPVFRRRRFFHGHPAGAAGAGGGPREPADIAWLTPGGREMSDHDWADESADAAVAVFLNGDAIDEPDRRGRPIRGDSFLLLFNAAEADLAFTLPPARYGGQWIKVLDTACPNLDPETVDAVKADESITVVTRSVQVLRRV
jgi:glycogen operon protein